MFDVAEFENGWGREGWNKQVAPAFFVSYSSCHVHCQNERRIRIETKDLDPHDFRFVLFTFGI